MKINLKRQLRKIPYANRIARHFAGLHVPPGHYYSPIISKEDLSRRKDQIWKKHPRQIPGLNLNEDRQFSLLKDLAKYYSDIPFEDHKKEGLRYYYNNTMYGYSDAVFLFCMIRNFAPKRIIEVGSGFSSAISLDTNHLFFDDKIQCTFIEPNPERLKSLLFKEEKINLIESIVQEVDLDLFKTLEENDILFIDSSHITKAGSDVNFLLFDVLPNLKKGVKIHFHDIGYPFEYPQHWVIDKLRGFNENYILRAFLMYNSNFPIIAFNTFLTEFHEAWFKEHMPMCLKHPGGSIWLEVN
ncbi:class I SAM-dependent methyltransferase [Ekhidna sp.]|uniref:class I SAM-dependent methyltransferase n=1 Tax=Ekhidna sp. TaxID=2608089 RepID=UPI003CCB7D91